MVGGPPSRPEGRKAEGGSSRPTWVMSEPTPEVVEELRRRFPAAVQLPDEAIRGRVETWAAKGVVVRSLGRRVAVDAVVRELRLRGRLEGEVQGFPMDEKLAVLSFTVPGDRDKALQRPWVVNGQALALERWRPRFSPTRNIIRSAVVWVRLPWLPLEYWEEETLRSIVKPAGELVCLDECTINNRRLGFARVAIRIALDRPLRPGVVIGDPEGGWWQRFVYEHLAGICFTCGMFHDGEGGCPAVEKGGAALLQPADFTGDPIEEGEGSPGRQELGPWIAAVRRWLPAERKGQSQRKESQQADGPPVPSRQIAEDRGKQPLVFGAVPERSPPTEGWSKPAKVARRRSPPREAATGTVAAESPNPFSVLPEGGEKMMAQGTAAQSKRARSPGRPAGPVRGVRKAQSTAGVSKAKGGVLGQPKSFSVGHSMGILQEPFFFSAGGPLRGSSPPPPGDPSAPEPVPMEELSVLQHDDAVGRLRQALQEEGGRTMEMEDPIEGVSGGFSVGLRDEDPSTSTVAHD